MELSINMANGNSCNMNCAYCSGKLEKAQKIKIDEKKLIQRLYQHKKHLTGGKELLINLWGGEPFMKLEALEYLIALTKEVYPEFKLKYFISTNGLLLSDMNVLSFIEKHKEYMMVQLSHDGLGQSFRSKGRDPLLDPETKNSIVQLMKKGILTLINVTLSGVNPSINGNMFYFNKFMVDNNVPLNKVEVKLNHINDSDYTSEFNFTSETLSLYIHEYEQAYIQTLLNPKNPTTLMYKPYFDNQMSRDNLYDGLGGGACAKFINGVTDYTFSINTLGNYVPCQLWDTSDGIPNPNCEMPYYCKHCEYLKYNECHPCPTQTFPEKCLYRKEFIRLVLRCVQLRKLFQGGSCQRKN